MKIDVEIISQETIKPSCPTPHHLKNYQLSFLDQISPPVYMPLILFYQAKSNDYDDDDAAKLSNTTISSKLKSSLSEALTHFHPLAGRLVDNISIDCNDKGVPFLECRANCRLSEAIQDHMLSEFKKFIPFKNDDHGDILLAIQLNFFKCGGFAIGACFSHKAADAFSSAMFITNWAATARGGDDSKHLLIPQFNSAELFPSRNISGFEPSVGITKEKIVLKKFVFSNSSVAALREKYADYTNNNCPTRPTRIQALSAFIWDRYAAATEMESKKKVPVVFHAVNLRPRMEPPLPDSSFGNFYRVAIAAPSLEPKERGIDLVRQMNDSIKNVDSKYVKSLQESDKHLDLLKGEAEKLAKGEIVAFGFTSLCRFPLYEVDFGWEKPQMVGSTGFSYKNLVSFMDTKDGGGVEAWTNLEEADMAKFEADTELLAYASTG